MSKIRASLLVCASLVISSTAWADPGWKKDCQAIESQGPAQGACSAIQTEVQKLEAYAPIKPFHDLTTTGSSLDSKFPWGTPTWATGSGSGDSNVLDSNGGSNGGGSSPSENSNDSGTFQ